MQVNLHVACGHDKIGETTIRRISCRKDCQHVGPISNAYRAIPLPSRLSPSRLVQLGRRAAMCGQGKTFQPSNPDFREEMSCTTLSRGTTFGDILTNRLHNPGSHGARSISSCAAINWIAVLFCFAVLRLSSPATKICEWYCE